MKTPLRYQLTEYDCGPTSLMNGIAFLFQREEIPPEVPRNIMLFSLDNFGADGDMGKSGTSHAAMMFLSHWLQNYGATGRLAISSTYLAGEEVHLSQNSRLRDALTRGGAAVVRLDLEEWHYVLLTGIEGERVQLFDPYLFENGEYRHPDIAVVEGHPFQYNRLVPIERLEDTERLPYAFGPIEEREAVLIFNTKTVHTEEDTVEYFI